MSGIKPLGGKKPVSNHEREISDVHSEPGFVKRQWNCENIDGNSTTQLLACDSENRASFRRSTSQLCPTCRHVLCKLIASDESLATLARVTVARGIFLAFRTMSLVKVVLARCYESRCIGTIPEVSFRQAGAFCGLGAYAEWRPCLDPGICKTCTSGPWRVCLWLI